MSTPAIHHPSFNQRSPSQALLQTLPTSQRTLRQSHSSPLAPNYSINTFFHAYTPVLRGHKLCDRSLFLAIAHLTSQGPLDRSIPLCYRLRSCQLFKNRWLGGAWMLFLLVQMLFDLLLRQIRLFNVIFGLFLISSFGSSYAYTGRWRFDCRGYHGVKKACLVRQRVIFSIAWHCAGRYYY